jgi:hypothetical protein
MPFVRAEVERPGHKMCAAALQVEAGQTHGACSSICLPAKRKKSRHTECATTCVQAFACSQSGKRTDARMCWAVQLHVLLHMPNHLEEFQEQSGHTCMQPHVHKHMPTLRAEEEQTHC